MKLEGFLISVPFFYFLVLFQTSFLVHFSFAGFVPNLVLAVVLLLTFCEEGLFRVFLNTPPQSAGLPNAGIQSFWWGIKPRQKVRDLCSLPRGGNTAIWAAVWAGFFLDVFSCQFIGFHIFILLGLVFLIKTILKRYVRIPIAQKI